AQPPLAEVSPPGPDECGGGGLETADGHHLTAGRGARGRPGGRRPGATAAGRRGAPAADLPRPGGQRPGRARGGRPARAAGRPAGHRIPLRRPDPPRRGQGLGLGGAGGGHRRGLAGSHPRGRSAAAAVLPGDADGPARRGPAGGAVSSQSVSVAGRTLRVSNLDKVLYPATGTTKGEVLTHYVTHAEQILPELERRPVTRIRWPEGVEKGHFFEKNLPSGARDWLPRVTVPTPGSSRGRDPLTFPLVTDLAGLVYLVNLGSLELHVPQWRVDDDGSALPPDRMVIDLDPGPGAGLAECARVALLVRERL